MNHGDYRFRNGQFEAFEIDWPDEVGNLDWIHTLDFMGMEPIPLLRLGNDDQSRVIVYGASRHASEPATSYWVEHIFGGDSVHIWVETYPDVIDLLGRLAVIGSSLHIEPPQKETAQPRSSFAQAKAKRRY